jgi:uncharacterized protein with PIN domain
MPPAFAVERTLGRLGTWLRLMGFDALLERDCARGEFPARAAGRILLTRTRARFERRQGVGAVFIASDDPAGQRAEVVRRCGLRVEELRPFTRCLRCNDPIEPVARAEVERQVPDYVWETRESFSRCPRCGRVYWRGTHTERALETVRRLFEEAG